ncbi:MAG: 6-phosphogluconolactonase [Arenicella sp.]
MKWQCFNDGKEQAVALAAKVADDIQNLLRQQDTVTLCVPGGTTPALFFNHLNRYDDLDWSRVRLVLNDERWVPLNDPLSNDALLRQEFAKNAASNVHIEPLYNHDLAITDAVILFNRTVSPQLTIDICVLGMGEDGHTASLFAGMEGLADALDVNQVPALLAVKVANKPEHRVSWNVSALLTASRHYVLIKGPAKREVAATAAKQESFELPISYMLNNACVEIYYAAQP